MQRALAAADVDPNDPLEEIRRRVRLKRGDALAGGDPSATPVALLDFEVWQRMHAVPDELLGATVGPIWDCHFEAWCGARRDWAEREGWPGGEAVRDFGEREVLGRRPWDESEI
jgi:hypothetical protein